MQTEYNYQGKAMGTEFSIAIVSKSKNIADALAQAAQGKIYLYEARFSRFLGESELSMLNTKKSAVVSDEFFKVIEEAFRLFTFTKGIFNPLVQIERLGYNKTFDELTKDETADVDELYDIDFTTTVIDKTTHTVTLKEGQKLDFGGFLKGYLATELCREIMQQSKEVTGAIVNIGGDLHTEGFDENYKEFTFEIYNPITKKDDITLTVHNKSLATSGTYKRTWRRKNVLTNHILDTTGTQNLNTNIISASIIHKEGSHAEAYAKVFLSLGSNDALQILADTDVTYALIHNDGFIESNSL